MKTYSSDLFSLVLRREKFENTLEISGKCGHPNHVIFIILTSEDHHWATDPYVKKHYRLYKVFYQFKETCNVFKIDMPCCKLLSFIQLHPSTTCISRQLDISSTLKKLKAKHWLMISKYSK